MVVSPFLEVNSDFVILSIGPLFTILVIQQCKWKALPFFIAKFAFVIELMLCVIN